MKAVVFRKRMLSVPCVRAVVTQALRGYQLDLISDESRHVIPYDLTETTADMLHDSCKEQVSVEPYVTQRILCTDIERTDDVRVSDGVIRASEPSNKTLTLYSGPSKVNYETNGTAS